MKTMKKMMTLLAVAGLVLALAPAVQGAELYKALDDGGVADFAGNVGAYHQTTDKYAFANGTISEFVVYSTLSEALATAPSGTLIMVE